MASRRRSHRSGDIVLVPVDDQIGPGRSRDIRLLVAAHRRRHPRPRPFRKKDRRIARDAPSILYEDLLATNVGEQASVRDHRRNSEGRPDFEGHVVGQPDGLHGWQDDEFRRGTERPPRPDAV